MPESPNPSSAGRFVVELFPIQREHSFSDLMFNGVRSESMSRAGTGMDTAGFACCSTVYTLHKRHPDVTLSVFGEDGGHAGWNETAFIQAIDPKLVHKERYSHALATPNAAPGTYSAYPAPSSIGLYKEGQGYVKFDQARLMSTSRR